MYPLYNLRAFRTLSSVFVAACSDNGWVGGWVWKTSTASCHQFQNFFFVVVYPHRFSLPADIHIFRMISDIPVSWAYPTPERYTQGRSMHPLWHVQAILTMSLDCIPRAACKISLMFPSSSLAMVLVRKAVPCAECRN